LTLAFASAMGNNSEIGRGRIEPVVGLLYAAQIAVKLTAIPFVGLHFIFWVVATLWLGSPRLAVVRGLKTAFWSVVFLLPWLAFWGPDFLQVFEARGSAPALPSPPPHAIQFSNPLSFNLYLPVVAYTAAGAVICVACSAAVVRVNRLSRSDPKGVHAAAFIAVCCAAVANYLFYFAYAGPYVFDNEAAVRYAAPWLIACTGSALALGPKYWAKAAEPSSSRRVELVVGSLGLVVALMFAGTLLQRIKFLAVYRAPQAYVRLWQPEAIQLTITATTDAFHGALSAAVREAQSKIPPGAAILVWMTTAGSQLDYRRNRIFEVGLYQLVYSWTLIPKTDYVIWQYSGFGVRPPAEYADQIQNGVSASARVSMATLAFGNHLEELRRKSAILYNGEGIVAFRVSCVNGIVRC